MIYFKFGNFFLFGLIVISAGAFYTSPSQADSQDIDFLLTFDETCLSPCWWDLELGHDDKEAWYRLLGDDLGFYVSRYHADGYAEASVEAELNEQSDVFLLALTLVERGSTISSLSLSFEHHGRESGLDSLGLDYSLENILMMYGEPSEIYLYAEMLQQSVLLIYKERNVSFEYNFRSSESRENEAEGTIEICPVFDELFFFRVRAFSEANTLELQSLKGYDVFRSLEEVAQESVSSFTEKTLEDHSHCIVTLRDSWIEE
jgi:hypothetical protein